MAIATYCRVSTADQTLTRQLESTHNYTTEQLDASLNEVRGYRDKSTGTNTERNGYRDLMADIRAGTITIVVVHEISRLARSLRDLDRTVSRIVEADAEVHFVRDGLVFGDEEDSPMDRLMLQMLGAFAEWEARVKRRNTKEGIAARQANPEYHHGPAPLGFEKENSQLVENDNYDTICATLDMVAKGDLSKRQAARELASSRRTIGRCLERNELYGL